MGRIKIEDLPEDRKISMDEMRKVFGGNLTAFISSLETDLSASRDDPRLLGVDLLNWTQKTQWMSRSAKA